MVHDKAEFLEALVARMKAADDALHSGDPRPRRALWSAKEPVSRVRRGDDGDRTS